MPKPFGGGGSSAGATRPMARPTPGGGAPNASSRPQLPGQQKQSMGSRMAGFFPEQGSEAQYDMIMQLVQSGMSSAQSSGSPLANLLAPIAGAAIGGRATRKRDDAKNEAQGGMAASVLGDAANDPTVQGYIEVLNNPDTPGYLKSIAQAKLNSVIKGTAGGTKTTSRNAPRRSGGGRASPTGSKVNGQRNKRLYGNYDIGGIMHGRDSFGNMVPYNGPDGQPVKSTKSGGASAPATTSPASIVDELANLTTPAPSRAPAIPAQPVAPALDDSDPLGILGAPPA